MEGGEAAQGVAQHEHGLNCGESAVGVVADVGAEVELLVEVEPEVAPHRRGKDGREVG